MQVPEDESALTRMLYLTPSVALEHPVDGRFRNAEPGREVSYASTGSYMKGKSDV